MAAAMASKFQKVTIYQRRQHRSDVHSEMANHNFRA
eukprot:CAMPEP_0172923334 /NCGR_PEP_ID=MMETSP1075-20121228/209535_1 /TAXON_ID=2916 /ORGANISM="Ceratium fusus, Strain PA161109" /LENGTH=35 /DNA_ID= /DNA_START= /DNA_END= /DNA_ORIENTATION=